MATKSIFSDRSKIYLDQRVQEYILNALSLIHNGFFNHIVTFHYHFSFPYTDRHTKFYICIHELK